MDLLGVIDMSKEIRIRTRSNGSFVFAIALIFALDIWPEGTHFNAVILDRKNFEFVVYPGSYYNFDNVVWPINSIVKIDKNKKEIRIMTPFFYRGKNYPKNTKFKYEDNLLVAVD